MLLKSIKLENFRQFRNESIDFAQGEGGKNVTIIIGENGTGKTTFAQAFFWCLYGETEFSDKIILNKMVATEMTPGSEEKVRVTLALRHGEVDYTLIREQAYHKDYSNNVKGDNTVFDIAIKDTSGNTSYVKKSQCEAEVKSILPKELSRYFFFDGERIEKMSKDISTGKKATDFAEAVKGLLGLNAMISAIGHFNPRSSLSVIGSYEKSFDSKSNTKIQEYTAKIDKCNARLAEIDAALEELDEQKAAAEIRKSEKVIELKQYSEGEKLQKEKEDLQKQIDNITRMRATVYKTMCKDFNASMSPFFSLSLTKRALDVLSRHNYSGKDIPFIRDKTIEYLLKQKICLCGTHLDEGSVPYEKVKSLLDVIPPKSLSTYDFEKVSKAYKNYLDDNEKSVELVFGEGRNVVDRILSEFAPWKKRCRYNAELKQYTLQIFYQQGDEVELVVRLLGYGDSIQFKNKEQEIYNIYAARISKQQDRFRSIERDMYVSEYENGRI